MTVQQRVLSVIAQETHRKIREDELDKNFDELGVDSLDRVCILFGLEKEFGLTIPEEEARMIRNVRQMIERLTGVAQASAGASTTK